MTLFSQRAQRARRRPPRLAYLRSILPVLLLFLCFALGLTSFAFLAHIKSPVAVHRIGWQAFEPIEVVGDQGAGTNTNTDGETQITNLRLDIWDPTVAHTTGLTEIAVKSCVISPSLLHTTCRPPSTPEEDTVKGKWVLVSPNLNTKSGYMHLNVWYRRTRRLDADLITDLKLLPDPPPKGEDLAGWTEAAGDLRTGTWSRRPSLRLWYKTRSPKSAADMESHTDIITELSAHFGGGDPFFGFERVRGQNVSEGEHAVELIYRRGNPSAPQARRLQFHNDGSFKVMQIADLHYSNGKGSCRDAPGVCEGDADTTAWLNAALDAEKPDLVVFSGDQLNGQGSSYESLSVLSKFSKPVIDRKIPWAAVFGNHDSEMAKDRHVQMRALAHMPYSLARAGPADVAGVGNYDLRVYSADPSRTHTFTFYFLDSHAYKTSWKSPFSYLIAEYDFIKPSQIDWYLNVSSTIKPIQRPFKPDGGADLGNIWARRGPRRQDKHDVLAARQNQSSTLGKPNAMMWFHIPLQEAYATADKVADKDLDVGSQLEGQSTSNDNSGLFANGILKGLELAGDPDATATTEIKVLSHGHCHNTDRCRRVSGVWMCFDGGSSYTGYGAADFDRRVRVFDISQWGETIASYKRLTSGDIVDRQVLVGDGAPEGWGRGGA